MNAAIVTAAGVPPTYGTFAEPEPAGDEERIAVAAAALTQLTRARAAGSHYSSTSVYPFVAGVDGVGRRADGQRVYFVLPRAPFGGMAERTVVRRAQCVPIPDGLDDATAAALANPAMSSWAALVERARFQTGETVLINGATGTSGRLAVQIASHLGAKRIVATGRNVEALAALAAIGADATIPLGDEAALDERLAAEFAAGVDVVLDYLWGASAERILAVAAKAGRAAVPIRFVQIGAMSGGSIAVPAAILRSSAIELLGSGIGSVSLERLVHAIAQAFAVAVPAGFSIPFQTVPLTDVARAWQRPEERARIVFTLG